jgi:dynein heavy chain
MLLMLLNSPPPTTQVRRNLHVVFSFSPVGEAFRERLSAFPSLVNCTTIDWFVSWPRDALHTVATNFLAGLPGCDDKVCVCLLGGVSQLQPHTATSSRNRSCLWQHAPPFTSPTPNKQVLRVLPELCVTFHEDVQRLAADYLSQQRRHYYVTSTSYLELLTSYKKLLAKRQDVVRKRAGGSGLECRLFPVTAP